MSEQIKPIPAATAEDVRGGWKINFEFLEHVADRTEWGVSLEAAHEIILELERGGYLSIQHPELLKEGDG